MINNLDSLRTEHFPDGTTIERSIRDWAATIRSLDGMESAHCDVVNGGYDQERSYLLMAPQYEGTVKVAFESYCRRVYLPFHSTRRTIQRERGPASISHPR